MAKLVVNKYKNKNGEEKINTYFASIPKHIVQEVGFTKDTKIKIYVENKKIIIEEDKGDK